MHVLYIVYKYLLLGQITFYVTPNLRESLSFRTTALLTLSAYPSA